MRPSTFGQLEGMRMFLFGGLIGALGVAGACGGQVEGAPAVSLSDGDLLHVERIDLEEPVGFGSLGFGGGVYAMRMVAGDRTLVTGMAGHQESSTDPETRQEMSERGALAVFELDGGRWSETDRLAFPNAQAEPVGYYVATDDETIIASVGAGGLIASHPTDAVIFERRGGAWELTQTLEDVGCIAGMDVDGDVAVFGDCCPEEGASEGEVSVARAHVYRRADGRWTKSQELRTSLRADSNGMGSRVLDSSIALHRSTLVVGAPRYDRDPRVRQSGIAFVFQTDATEFREAWTLEPPLPEEGGHFGEVVAIHERRIAVSAPGEKSFRGQVHLFGAERGWTRIATLEPDYTRWLVGFGTSVAVRGDSVLVGAPLERGEQPGVNVFGPVDPEGPPYGAAYLFQPRDDIRGERWGEVFYLKDRELLDSEGFGAAVALTDDSLVVGAPGLESAGFLQVWTYRARP